MLSVIMVDSKDSFGAMAMLKDNSQQIKQRDKNSHKWGVPSFSIANAPRFAGL